MKISKIVENINQLEKQMCEDDSKLAFEIHRHEAWIDNFQFMDLDKSSLNCRGYHDGLKMFVQDRGYFKVFMETNFHFDRLQRNSNPFLFSPGYIRKIDFIKNDLTHYKMKQSQHCDQVYYSSEWDSWWFYQWSNSQVYLFYFKREDKAVRYCKSIVFGIVDA